MLSDTHGWSAWNVGTVTSITIFHIWDGCIYGGELAQITRFNSKITGEPVYTAMVHSRKNSRHCHDYLLYKTYHDLAEAEQHVERATVEAVRVGVMNDPYV